MSEVPMFGFGAVGTLRIAFASVSPSSGTSTGARQVSRRRHKSATTRAASPLGTESREVVFRRLFDDYWPRVHRHLSCYIDDGDEVDEITAEIFTVAWRKLDADRPMPLTWFLRAANNKLRDRSRRVRSRDLALEALVRGLETPSEKLDPLEVLALRTALIALSARERQIVVLTYWDDLSAGEVAEVLRTSQSAVWTTLTRARAKLREQLEGGGQGS
ncbi:sigma-70 family RNA polymerase sigma factor [Microbacterium sp. SSW1-49]|uniref:Sigma-70 family RNA polymerase sigma factor n=1 Tax=Microbacterium croceum TaxID=2851645 RepID=A0ABT0FAL5_9MICO|nr:sigma-70 family RNA polymerase sigma factor [Microbacterium croceum]MCK2035081.1 sigma-70 family RNA polymerase sigma factor [Microbacterium croceum]